MPSDALIPFHLPDYTWVIQGHVNKFIHGTAEKKTLRTRNCGGGEEHIQCIY
jgi:hypothetical protein